MSDVGVSKTLTICSDPHWKIEVSSGEVPGMIDIDYVEPKGPDSKERRITVSFTMEMAGRVSDAILEVAQHEKQELKNERLD